MKASERLARELAKIDVLREPDRMAQGATLLGLAQRLESEQAQLDQQIERFVRDDAEGRPQADAYRSIADWAYEVLAEHGRPMRYRDIAAEIRARGFQHARQPKSPNQLAESTWSAMYEDSKRRFVRVGRGIWDLAERHGDEGQASP